MWTWQQGVQHHRSWTEETGERVRRHAVADLREGLYRRRPHASLHELARGLDSMAEWLAHAASVEIAEGRAEGWARIHDAWLCHAWACRIWITLHDRTPRIVLDRLILSPGRWHRVALCLGYALAVGEPGFRAWCGPRLLRELRAAPSYWKDRPLQPFLAQLFAWHEGMELDVRRDLGIDAGPYDAALDAWDDPEGLAAALSGLCDFHVERTNDRLEGAPRREAFFDAAPFDLVPVELLAIERVRAHLRLDTLPVAHPLLESPLAALPPTPPEPGNSLLTAAIEKAREGLDALERPRR